jgi:hypothetical protein
MPERGDTPPGAPQAVSLLRIMLLFGRVGLTSFGGAVRAWL